MSVGDIVLGRFLEFSVATADIQASLDFYRRLKFSENSVGDAWPHPYAVITDGRICIGLHQAELSMPTLTFVKPDLIKFLPEAGRANLTLEYSRLGNHVFNEIGFLDPQGQATRLIEARTFSPSERRATDNSLCGYFEEIALPCADRATAKEFWETCGFVAVGDVDAPFPHVDCTSDSIDIGIYDTQILRQASLIFASANLPALLEAASSAGIEPSKDMPAPLSRRDLALFIAPEGTRILIGGEPQ